MSDAKKEAISRDSFTRQVKDGKKVLVPKDIQLLLPLEDVVPEKTRKGELNQNSIVQQSKFLTYVPTGYSELEQNFMTLVQSNIQPTDEELPDLSFSITDIASFLGLRKDRLYTDIPKMVSNLGKVTYEFPFEFDGELGYASMPFFSAVIELKGKILCKINPNLKPFLLPKTLWKNAGRKIYKDVPQKLEITKYYAEKRLSLQGKYTKSIYVILITEAYKDFPFQISVKELRYVLHLGNKFPEFKEFKRNILTPAEKEINEKSDIFFKYDTIKTGNKVTDLVFHIFPQSLSAGLARLKEELDYYGIGEESARHIFDTLKISQEQVAANLILLKKKLKGKNRIEDAGNWLYCAITRNYAEKSRAEMKIEEKIVLEKKSARDTNARLKEICAIKQAFYAGVHAQIHAYIEARPKTDILDDFLAHSKRKFSVMRIKEALSKKADVAEIFSVEEYFSAIKRYIAEKMDIDVNLVEHLRRNGIAVTDAFLAENQIARKF